MLKVAALTALFLFNSGCMLTYLAKSGYHQGQIFQKKVDLDQAIKSSTGNKREKLLLIKEVRHFSNQKLGLKETKNYTDFVQLEHNYVSWIVRASKKDSLTAYTWWFPIVGDVPYKGYFNKEDALKEAETLKKEGYDTYVRGVSAYSTLGWFEDPILSSMLRYAEHDLVDLIIHESTHATLFIKDNVDFNERLATFVGRIGTHLFYKEKEGASSKTIQKIKAEEYDQSLFSEFIGQEIKDLKAWYKKQTLPIPEEERKKRLEHINKNFVKKVQKKLKSDNYKYFTKLKLNNAILLSYNTYIVDLKDFEKAYIKLDKDIKKFLSFCSSLEKSSNPEKSLKDFIN